MWGIVAAVFFVATVSSTVMLLRERARWIKIYNDMADEFDATREELQTLDKAFIELAEKFTDVTEQLLHSRHCYQMLAEDYDRVLEVAKRKAREKDGTER
jgi:hypothetical protein